MKKSGPNWLDLHDTTLLELRTLWDSGDLTLTLRAGSESAPNLQIRGLAARLVEWPRRHPWGSSVSINEVRGPTRTADGEAWRLEIEMQSGDAIVLEARQFQLEGVNLGGVNLGTGSPRKLARTPGTLTSDET